jgi:hypothetical protein
MYAPAMRSRVRVWVFAVAAVLIVVSWLVESPGTVEAVGLAVVLVVMLVLLVRELRRPA